MRNKIVLLLSKLQISPSLWKQPMKLKLWKKLQRKVWFWQNHGKGTIKKKIQWKWLYQLFFPTAISVSVESLFSTAKKHHECIKEENFFCDSLKSFFFFMGIRTFGKLTMWLKQLRPNHLLRSFRGTSVSFTIKFYTTKHEITINKIVKKSTCKNDKQYLFSLFLFFCISTIFISKKIKNLAYQQYLFLTNLYFFYNIYIVF